jgi:dienelactone hydrolase
MSISTYGRAALAAFTVLLAACSSTTPSHDTTTAPVPSVSVPPTRPVRCGAGAHAFWLPGPDGSKQEANAFGSGATTAIFLHEAGIATDMCGFWDYARWVAEHRHVRVLLFNRCTYGNTTCRVYQEGDSGLLGELGPAVRWARRGGAHRVVLVGASSGASDALQAAGIIRGIDSVVALSSDRTDTRTSETRNAARVHVPSLLAVAPGDRTSPIAAVRRTYRLIPARDKRLIIVHSAPGAHGWELLQSTDGTFSPLARTVADFLVG